MRLVERRYCFHQFLCWSKLCLLFVTKASCSVLSILDKWNLRCADFGIRQTFVSFTTVMNTWLNLSYNWSRTLSNLSSLEYSVYSLSSGVLWRVLERILRIRTALWSKQDIQNHRYYGTHFFSVWCCPNNWFMFYQTHFINMPTQSQMVDVLNLNTASKFMMLAKMLHLSIQFSHFVAYLKVMSPGTTLDQRWSPLLVSRLL